ncbi:MAG: hypothetical protein A3G00_02710 [Candidatus Magasanikbacteria bacterium RIFCSPLOWO2_12_FULL_43_12]|uniref:PEP-utilising enzyme mobile domain-containing protein n=1 Tax=Candidatus Magasanikbacteria bacterium RIFCSPLOWO2_12_FULL_43_12 TaxID=1798692 RepID=A0A1F6MRI0_9BACT|nr:MAG: hypothetical protein A3G00_02710 [Candidatus Magasanikbacteria bacterium RIFCSPLOWO2_12_FULL_43_12]
MIKFIYEKTKIHQGIRQRLLYNYGRSVVLCSLKRTLGYTYEGGQLCHAAIISRELKIPCIIGTKNASETYKNGDLIEVNADKGIVKKIKQNT